MKILFDLSAAQPYKSVLFSGGGNYSFSLLKKILTIQSDVEIFLSQERDENIEINKYLVENNLTVHRIKSVNAIEQLINNGCYRVVIIPVCFPKYAKLKLHPDQKIITVIHDLSSYLELNEGNIEGRFTFKIFRDWLRFVKANLFKEYYRMISKRQHLNLLNLTKQQLIITDSYYSRETILGLSAEIEPENVVVSYPAITGVHKDVKSDVFFNQYGIVQDKYFLLVSGDRWTKNNYIAIKALYQLLKKSDIKSSLADMKIVVVGNSMKSTKLFSNLTENDDHFVFLSYVSQSELAQLFKYCHALVYPTLIEGFGLPPFEVLRYGKISLCSSNTSLPDIYENSVIYFNPYDIHSIKVAIRKSFNNSLIDSYNMNQKRIYEYISSRQESDLSMILDFLEDVN